MIRSHKLLKKNHIIKELYNIIVAIWNIQDINKNVGYLEGGF